MVRFAPAPSLRVILAVLILLVATASSEYQAEEQVDNSIDNEGSESVTQRSQEEGIKKQRTFSDDQTKFIAYKDGELGICYLERMLVNTSERNVSLWETFRGKPHQRTLYVSDQQLTKTEAWRLAGGRIIEFCQGFSMKLLQETKPVPGQTQDPFLNEIQEDENDVLERRVTDVVLTPLQNRAKRQIELENRDRMNSEASRRSRRQAPYRGRFRGQTQSQYLNYGGEGKSEGKAAAESTLDSSHAVVSGTNGMGQAQSMSSSGSGCEDCPGYGGSGQIDGAPGKYVDERRGSARFPGGQDPSIPYQRIVPLGNGGQGTYVGNTRYPGQDQRPGIHPGSGSQGHGGLGGVKYHDEIAPRIPSGSGSAVYPGVPHAESHYPENPYPGAPGVQPGGSVYPPSGRPSQGGAYPGTDGTAGSDHGTGGRSKGSQGSEGWNFDGGFRRQPDDRGVYPSGGSTGSGTGGTHQGDGQSTAGKYPAGGGGGTHGSGGYDQRQPGPGTQPGYPWYPDSGVGTGSDARTNYPGRGYPGDGGGVPPHPISPGGADQRPGVTDIGGRGGDQVSRPGGIDQYPGRGGDQVSRPGGIDQYSGHGGGQGSGAGGIGHYPGRGGDQVSRPGGIDQYPGHGGGQGSEAGGNDRYPGHGGGQGSGAGGIDHYPGRGGDQVSRPGGIDQYPGRGGDQVSRPGGIDQYPGRGGDQVSRPGGIDQYSGHGGGQGSGAGGIDHYPGRGGDQVSRPGGIDQYPGRGGDQVSRPGGIDQYPGRGGDQVSRPGGIDQYPGSGGDHVSRPGGIDQYPGRGGDQVSRPGGIDQYPGRGGDQVSRPGGIDQYSGHGGGQGSGAGGIDRYPGRGGDQVSRPGGIDQYSGRGGDQASRPGGIDQYPGRGGEQVSRPGGIDQYYGHGGGQGSGAGGNDRYPGRGGDQVSRPGGIDQYSGHGGGQGSEAGGNDRYPGRGGDQVSRPGGIDQYSGHGGGQGSGAGGIDRYPGRGGDQVSRPGGIDQYSGHGGGQGSGAGGIDRYPGRGGDQVSRPGGIDQYSGHGGGQGSGAGGFDQYSRGGGGQGSGTGGSGAIPNAQSYPPNGGQGSRTGVGETGTSPGNGGLGYQTQQEVDDGSDSQASSSVTQGDSGTQASASALGTHGQGTAQSQVSGTYSGSGSFSAQAGTSDANKAAQTQVSGGKKGAVSSAQGRGGIGKSQAQVSLDTDTGATSSDAQSNGWNHGTMSQVQATSKGGMADAQANGVGSTSSQAQIGFQPHLKENDKLDKRRTPFRGGGKASAQGGTYRGQSQSQLEGSFQYGISYTGAAQAGSGSGVAASREPFKFSNTEEKLFKTFEPLAPVNTNASEEASPATPTDDESQQENEEQGLQTSDSHRSTNVVSYEAPTISEAGRGIDVYPVRGGGQELGIGGTHTDTLEEEPIQDTDSEDYSEEQDEDYDNPSEQMQPSQSGSRSSNSHDLTPSQQVHNSGGRNGAYVTQNSSGSRLSDVLQPGDAIYGYTIPPGMRGRVVVDKTLPEADGDSQSQFVVLTPGNGNATYNGTGKSAAQNTKSLNNGYNRNRYSTRRYYPGRPQYVPSSYLRSGTRTPEKPNYYTVTNSVSGQIDDHRNPARKYEHRYYTKSSTCGYFTFSCNIVYGPNGRTKICKPKMPTNPDGTPMRC